MHITWGKILERVGTVGHSIRDKDAVRWVWDRSVRIADVSVRGCGSTAIFNIYVCLKKPKLRMQIIRRCRPACVCHIQLPRVTEI